MGFYPPASLVRDAQRRGVEVQSPDINLSMAWCSLEPVDDSSAELQSPLARQLVRIGLAYVQSVGEDDAVALVDERDANGPYLDVGNLARRAPLSGDGLVALVEGGACDSFGKRRRDVLWELGLARRPARCPGRRAQPSSSRWGSLRPLPHRRSATSRAGSGCSPTTG